MAGDRFLPRQLTKRGHRLAFSNGILVLAAVALVLVLAFKAQVNGLVALYAIGVFTGFTFAGAGMVKHHHDACVGNWKRGIAVNGVAALLSFVVVLIFAVVKFKEGAWLIFIVGPLLYIGLIRTNRQYKNEADMLETGVAEASEAPVLRHHVVVVFVDRLDMATARALQYARTLAPDDIRAVHFDLDTKAARELEAEWSRLGLARLPLDIIECRDRRIGRAAIELLADATVDGDTECTVLLPRRTYAGVWERFLHDRTADKIAAVVGQVPHVSATIVPFAVSGGRVAEVVRASGRSAQTRRLEAEAAGTLLADGEVRPAPDRAGRREGAKKPVAVLAADETLAKRAGATTPIAAVAQRQRVRVAGRVKSVRVQPRAGTSNLECVLSDGSGGLLLVFQGRPKIAGIDPGARLVAEGMVGTWGRRPALLNPSFEIVQGASGDPSEG